MSKVIAISLIAVVMVAAGFFYYRSRMQKQYGVYGPSSMSQTSTNPQTNNSNAQLDNDLNSVSSQLDSVSSEQTGIDAGLNQTAPNVQ